MQVVVDDLLTRYELFGKGKLVLLLHGWGDDSRSLRALQTDLSQKYQVVSLDLPGFGQTQAPADSWNLDDYGKFLNRFLQKISAGELYAAVGHSNGGAVLIRALALGELHAEKLVLVAASGIRSNAAGKKLLLKALAKAGNIATIWMPERYRKSLRTSLYSAAGSDALVVEDMRKTFEKVVKQDVQADAAKLTLPALLLYAENDAAVPVSDGRRYQELIKGSQLRIIPGAGHFVHLDEPGLVSAAIKDFLA